MKDTDIGASYVGECVAGFAEGHGKASGRDTYEGTFLQGEPHGLGRYSWGPDSEWAGQSYEGAFFRGTRSGFGKYVSTQTRSVERQAETTSTGLWVGGELIRTCDSMEECKKAFKISSLDDVPEDIVVTSKFYYRWLQSALLDFDTEHPGASQCTAYRLMVSANSWDSGVLTKPEMEHLREAIVDVNFLLGVAGYCRQQLAEGLDLSNAIGDPYQTLDSSQLVVDLPNMVPGDMVRVRGDGMSIQQGTLMLRVKGANMIAVDTSQIPRQQKLDLINRCGEVISNCAFTVSGKVGRVALIMPGLIADSVEIS